MVLIAARFPPQRSRRSAMPIGHELLRSCAACCHIVGTERGGLRRAAVSRNPRDPQVTVTALHCWVGPTPRCCPTLRLPASSRRRHRLARPPAWRGETPRIKTGAAPGAGGGTYWTSSAADQNRRASAKFVAKDDQGFAVETTRTAGQPQHRPAHLCAIGGACENAPPSRTATARMPFLCNESRFGGP